MSTDTENGALATEVDAATFDAIESALEQLRAWAEKKRIPFEAVVDALKGDEMGSIKQPLPPNHTCVTWFDIHRPDGGKIHVVVRGGATRGSVLDVVFTASNAFGDLVEQGWLPADRRPRTEEEIAETKAKMEEKLTTGAKRKAAKKADSGNGQDPADTRTIEVDTILKKVNDSGNLCYLVKGFPWRGYGATAWPDSSGIKKLARLVDMDAWKVGELIDFTDNDIHAVCTQKMGSKGKMIPIKVIDFVGEDALSDTQSSAGDSYDEIPF